MKFSIKNKAFLLFSSALLAAGATSCKTDLLDQQPQILFSDQVVFDTPARVTLQVNGLYSFVKVGGFLGGRYQVFSDIRADDFINRTSNAVTGLSVWNHTLTETSQNDVINLWTNGYAAINQINVFLTGMEANSGKFVAPVFAADYATTTAVQYQAEARLLRALCYYSLLQFYARPYADGNGSRPGLPLRLRAETGQLDGDNLARSTVAETYAQILADLNYAETNLPATYTTANLNITRAHRNTAIALKTRVYLSMRQYADVIREANKIVPLAAPFTAANGGVANGLSSTITAVFSYPQQSLESILSFPFTAQNTAGTQNQLAYYYLPPLTANQGGNGEYYLNTSGTGILANSALSATDVRRTSFVTTAGGNSYLRKFGNLTPFLDNAPVIRYAEVMLSLAEALSATNGATDLRALALLNAVRTRSGGTAYTTATVANILLERRIEFLGEGIRNGDIMRQLAPIPAKGTISAVEPSNPLYIWPIPATELATNTLMTRN